MYIDMITLDNFRVFRKSKVEFIHPDCEVFPEGSPKAALPNINLLLADNGLGKTTLLKAVALAALGPAVGDSGIYPYHLVRREPACSKRKQPERSVIRAEFTPHKQDHVDSIGRLESEVTVLRRDDLESLRWTHGDEKAWHPVFKKDSDAFFLVGYGATRRVEKGESANPSQRSMTAFTRAQRIQSLFEEAYSLIPLNAWLPEFRHENPGRHKQVVNLINRLLGKGQYEFTGELEDNEYIFTRKGMRIPFPALSDGYRALLGWVGDLLFHVCETCPSGNKLVDNKGIILVDEIDLHLHPEWQMKILPTLAKALPKIQFILTSHSPLLVGSLEWMNIIVMEESRGQFSRAMRLEEPVNGLDADQILLTDYFGLKSTRAKKKGRQLKNLALKARAGDTESAKRLLQELSHGLEGKK